MWLVAGFFDESTDEDSGGTCYTVAGFIGPQLVTATLELRWRDVLNRYELKYFKASELSAGTGQFQKFRDDPTNYKWRPFSEREKEIFKQVKTDFTDVIVGCGEGLYGVGAVVILPDLERLRAEHKNARALPTPYFICANMCMVEAGLEMAAQNVGHKGDDLCWLRPIFDSHEDYSGLVKQQWDTFSLKNPNAAKYLLPPHYEKDEDYLTLQAADNLAFEARKLIFTQRQQMRPREAMRRLVQNRNILRIAKFDYDALKMTADAQFGIYPKGIKRQALTPPLIEQPISAMKELVNEGTNEQNQPGIPEVRRDNAATHQGSTQQDQSQAGRGERRKKAEA
jgi:hypothetical protein